MDNKQSNDEVNRIFNALQQFVTIECMLKPPKENPVELMGAITMFCGWFISLLNTEGDKAELREMIVNGIIHSIEYYEDQYKKAGFP